VVSVCEALRADPREQTDRNLPDCIPSYPDASLVKDWRFEPCSFVHMCRWRHTLPLILLQQRKSINDIQMIQLVVKLAAYMQLIVKRAKS